MKAQNGRRWQTDEVKTLIGRWLDGAEINALAVEFNSTRYAINKLIGRIRKEGIPLPRRTVGHVAGRRNKPWTPEEVEYVVRRRNDRVTAETIASELDRTFLGVQGLIQRLRREQIPIKMLGSGVRKLWNPDALKIALAGRGLIDLPETEIQ